MKIYSRTILDGNDGNDRERSVQRRENCLSRVVSTIMINTTPFSFQ